MTDLLLINLGMGRTDRDPPYDEVTYVFEDGFEVRTALAGLALWRWLAAAKRAPSRVAFVATAAAWTRRRGFARKEVERLEGIDPARLDAERLETRLPSRMADLWADLAAIEAWCARHRGDAVPVLHLDLTHSFRAIPLAQLLLLRYLESRGSVRVGFLGYGVYTPENDANRARMLDLAVLMRAADWAAAVRDFRGRFDPQRLTELLAAEEEAPRRAEIGTRGALSRRRQEAGRWIRAVVGAAQRSGESFRAGLPIEVGVAAAGASVPLDRLEPEPEADDGVVPRPVAGLLRELAESLRPLATASGGKAGKAGVLLDEREISRQLELVRRWSAVGDAANGIEALRELMVNRVLLARGTGTPEWLSTEVRKSAEEALNALAPGRSSGRDERVGLASAQREIGSLWNNIAADRNSVAHAGMGRERVDAARLARRLDERLIPAFEDLHREAGDAWRLDGLAEIPEGEET